VDFVLFEDGTLPRHSSVDFVLHGSLARQLPDWIRDATRTDAVSQCFARGLGAAPFHVLAPTMGQVHSCQVPTFPSPADEVSSRNFGHDTRSAMDMRPSSEYAGPPCGPSPAVCPVPPHGKSGSHALLDDLDPANDKESILSWAGATIQGGVLQTALVLPATGRVTRSQSLATGEERLNHAKSRRASSHDGAGAAGVTKTPTSFAVGGADRVHHRSRQLPPVVPVIITTTTTKSDNGDPPLPAGVRASFLPQGNPPAVLLGVCQVLVGPAQGRAIPRQGKALPMMAMTETTAPETTAPLRRAHVNFDGVDGAMSTFTGPRE